MIRFPQYEDRVQYQTPDEDAVYDETTGKWTPGAGGQAVDILGRYEANTGPSLAPTVDGRRVDFSGVVQLPLSAPAVPEGTPVTITKRIAGRPDVVLKAQVISFIPDRLHCRMYV